MLGLVGAFGVEEGEVQLLFGLHSDSVEGRYLDRKPCSSHPQALNLDARSTPSHVQQSPGSVAAGLT